jgi:hypothetical protein
MRSSIKLRNAQGSRSSGIGFDHRYGGNSYYYEADEVRACVERGVIESRVMPLNDSIAVAETADSIRTTLRVQLHGRNKPA